MLVNCLECEVQFNKSPKEIRRSQNHYCSRSCAAKRNNRLYPKRKALQKTVEGRICPDCAGPKDILAISCRACKRFRSLRLQMIRPLSDFLRMEGSTYRYNRVRELARRAMHLWNLDKKCQICDFDQVVEVCHLKPVKDFSVDTKLEEINSKDNLVYLCPNHHAMLDKGLLAASERFELSSSG